MKRNGRGLSIRGTLIAIALTGVVFVLSLALEIATVIEPRADALSGHAGALLLEHDEVSGRLSEMRATLSDLEDTLSARRVLSRPLSLREAAALIAPVQARLDSVVTVRASMELGQVPSEMRLRLAEAVEAETAAGLMLLDAVRAMQRPDLLESQRRLRRAEVMLDSTSHHLAEAQRVAVADVVAQQQELLAGTRRLAGISVGWVVLGGLLLGAAIWIVRRRLYLPLASLEQAVLRVQDGDLEAEASVLRPDEVGRLGAHFNAMTAVLRERVASESRRREALRERFRRILDESSNEIYIFTADSLRFVQANRRARQNLGYGMTELEGLGPCDILRDSARESLEAALDILRRGQQPSLHFSAAQTRKDGSTYPVEITLTYSTADDPAVFIAVVVDVTERARARELHEQLRKFGLHKHRLLSGGNLSAAIKAITEMAADALGVAHTGVWLCTGDGLRCLDSFDRERRIHTEGEEVRERLEPAYLAALRAEGLIAANDARQDPRTRDLTGPHGPRPALRAQLDAPVRAAGRLVAVATHQHHGGPRAWTAEEQAFASSVADLVALAMESAQRHSLEHQLARAQKMESVGRLAGGVAHDFNNLLTAILGYSESARERLPVEDPLHADLGEIEKAGRRAAELTKQLLTFARGQVAQPKVVDLNALVQGAEKLLRRLIGADVELVGVLEPDLGRVVIDPGQMEQVILNLAVNARDAMPGGGRLTMRTRNLEADLSHTASHAEVEPGPYVELTVSDTGEGMDEATQGRLFEPFFTTKEPGKGTGLGLATCYGIIRQAGGAIWASSRVGAGTTFTVLLPRVRQGVEEQRVRPEALRAPGGSETILLVEDEVQIRELAARTLRAQGYNVITAIHGEDALKLFKEWGKEIHLLVTDVVLPLVGGPELAARLRAKQAGMSVVYMSGYTRGELPGGELAEDGHAAFLAKPFTTRDLCRVVRNLLDRAPRPPALG